MSILNGLGSLGSSLSAVISAAAEDEQQRPRAPLLNSTPAKEADAVTTETDATAKPAAPTVAGVPANLLPLYQAASARTGIPVDVLIAQGKQESNFNPNAVGSAGEIGLHQIKPSTAAQPGYGLKGIDPADLRDPATNINFAADYLKARAGPGVNFSNPAVVDAALRAYNGGGDRNYVANVRQHMAQVQDFTSRLPPAVGDADPRMVVQPYGNSVYPMPNADVGNLNQAPGQEVAGYLQASARRVR